MPNLLAAVVAEGAWSAGPQPTLTDPLLTLRPWQFADAGQRSAALHLDGWHDMHLHARVAR